MTCTAFDFNYLAAGARCFWFSDDADSIELFPVPVGSRIDHFVRVNCSNVITCKSTVVTSTRVISCGNIIVILLECGLESFRFCSYIV